MYHKKVIQEMRSRGYHTDDNWLRDTYRGKILGDVDFCDLPNIDYEIPAWNYPEHDDNYLHECLDNLKTKGIEIHVQ
jgi:uncharacterized protein (TIGR02328 family)